MSSVEFPSTPGTPPAVQPHAPGTAVIAQPDPAAGAAPGTAESASEDAAVTGSSLVAMRASYDDDADLPLTDDPLDFLGS